MNVVLCGRKSRYCFNMLVRCHLIFFRSRRYIILFYFIFFFFIFFSLFVFNSAYYIILLYNIRGPIPILYALHCHLPCMSRREWYTLHQHLENRAYPIRYSFVTFLPTRYGNFTRICAFFTPTNIIIPLSS